MNTKLILSKSIQVITFLFAAFNNFLLNIAPPGEAESRYAIGISSMLSLFVLLFISAVSKNQSRTRYRRIWLSASLLFFIMTLISSVMYKSNLDKYTFAFPPESQKAEYIAGTTFTPEAINYKRENPLKTQSELVADFGGVAFIERIWALDSIRRSKLILTINYVIVVLSLASAIFCLTEGVLTEPKCSGGPRRSHTETSR